MRVAPNHCKFTTKRRHTKSAIYIVIAHMHVRGVGNYVKEVGGAPPPQKKN